MKRFFDLLLSFVCTVALCTGCSKEEEPTSGERPPVPETADQTLLFYLTGTSLGSNYRKNIDDIMSAIDQGVLHESRVLVFVEPQRSLSMVLELYHTPRNDEYDPTKPFSHEHCKIDTLRRWTNADFDSMDGGTVTEVLGYMARQAPARRYGLILGGHGLGWFPDGPSISGRKPSSFSDFWRPMPGALPTRKLGEGNETAEIPELATAFRNTGIHFDYLIFDACFMSSVEALYDLRDCADYIVASPCEIMAAGFLYSELLPALLTDAGKNYDLDRVCRNYCDYYTDRAPVRSGCIALTVCRELEALARTVKRMETASDRQPCDRRTMQTYEGLREHVFYDLGDYAKAICNDPDLLDEFDRRMERAFPEKNRLHTPSFYSAYGYGDAPDGLHPIRSYSGVTTSAPCELFAAEWQQTAWYAATH